VDLGIRKLHAFAMANYMNIPKKFEDEKYLGEADGHGRHNVAPKVRRFGSELRSV
jgi:hypothetical protein